MFGIGKNSIKDGLINKSDWKKKLSIQEVAEAIDAQIAKEPSLASAGASASGMIALLKTAETTFGKAGEGVSLRDLFDTTVIAKKDPHFLNSGTVMLVALQRHLNDLAKGITPGATAALSSAE